MEGARNVDYDIFLRRYEELKRLYFSPKSDPRYDSDGEEIPSAFLQKDQIVRIFTQEMRVAVPTSVTDQPRFLMNASSPE